jgi:hypothetical protein
MSGELRLVEDAEERRHRTIGAATGGFEGSSSRVVDRDAELIPVRDTANVRGRCSRLPSLVRDRERPDCFSGLAEACRVGIRDSNRAPLEGPRRGLWRRWRSAQGRWDRKIGPQLPRRRHPHDSSWLADSPRDRVRLSEAG